MDYPAKNDLLWASIARSIYAGFISYVIVVIVAYCRDLARNFPMSASSRVYNALARFYYRFSVKYRDTNVFYYVEFLRLLSNLVICVLYVMGTYQRDVPIYTLVVYRVLATIYILDLIIHLLLSESAMSTVVYLSVIVDAFTYPSLVLVVTPNDYLNFAYLRAVPVYFAYARLEERMFVHMFSQNRLVVKQFIRVLALFYVLAATIQLLELPGDFLSEQFKEEWDNLGQWTFMNSAYFIIVTLSTVGYGDFSPQTIQGRMYALFIIIIGILIFSAIASELYEQAHRDRGSGYFVKNSRTRHVIVSGTPNLNDLVLFITEFFSDPRQSNIAAKVVVLVDHPVWTDTEWFQYIARNQFLQSRLQFLRGSPRNSNDLARAKIDSADAVFILTSASTAGEGPSLQDTNTTMDVLAIRNVRNNVPIYAQTLLEDSNLQTRVALTTLSSDANTNESKYAKYNGLYNTVLNTDLRSLPRAYSSIGRTHMQSILNRYKQRITDVDIHDVQDSVTDSLKKSQHVCLQEIQMALIAGNIKANGVGTLLSNMYLDVSLSKLTKEDPGWLFEYLLGARVNIMYTIVPDELNGVSVKDIVRDLYHTGLILIAVSHPVDIHPVPILNTNQTLQSGDLAMVLTYHERMHVTGALHLVALRYARGELKYSGNGKSSRMMRGGESLRTPKTMGSTTGLNDESELKSFPFSKSFLTPSLSHVHMNVSADDLDDLAVTDDHDLTEDTEGMSSYIPEDIKGHIIISAEGQVPLQSLPLLLRNLWHKEYREALKRRKREKIIVIHPNVDDHIKKRFSRFDGKSLFFIEGSPASRSTWRKAKLSTANAVATIADITQPMALSDARTIFTLLTLDVSTANDHDLFICSELVDEKSLEYLREPSHARRRGAAFGEPMDKPHSIRFGARSDKRRQAIADSTMIESQEEDDRARAAAEDKDGPSMAITPTPGSNVIDGDATPAITTEARDDRGKKGIQFEAFEEHAGDELKMEKTGASLKDTEAGARENSAGGLKLAKLASKAMGKKGMGNFSSPANTDKPTGHTAAGDSKSLTLNIGVDAGNQNTLEESVDPNSRPGATRARRGTLFSRSRYASGELLVQSGAMTLLAREYVEPGFVSFFTNLLGTDAAAPAMKIRLVRIPKSLFDPIRGYISKDGRRLIRYNDVVHILIELGVTPIGIYRSGTAPVLIPHKMRRKRGQAIIEELEPLLAEVSQESIIQNLPDENIKMIGSKVKGLAKKMKDVNPAKQREIIGLEEVHGNMQHLFTTESSEEEDDEEDADGGNTSPGGIERRQESIRPTMNERIGEKVEYEDAAPPISPTEMSQILNVSSDKSAEGAIPDDDILTKPSARWGLGMFKGNGNEEPVANAKFVLERDPNLQVPGVAKYSERRNAENVLPYVYTLPEPNTWCAETDGIYILCDPAFNMPSKWTETVNEVEGLF